MTQYNAIEQFLRSRTFILCVALFSVLWLTPNTYWVYYSMMNKFSPGWRELVSGGMALIVASGILIYTIRGNTKVANYYMWFEISISSFYYIITIGWDWWLIPAFSFVFMLPVSLKHYTSELNKDMEGAPAPDILAMKTMQAELDTYKEWAAKAEVAAVEAKTINENLQQRMADASAEAEGLHFTNRQTIENMQAEIDLRCEELKQKDEQIYDLQAEVLSHMKRAEAIEQAIKVAPVEVNLANMTDADLVKLAKGDVNQLPKDLL